MDNKIILLVLVVVTSGCTQLPGSTSVSSGGSESVIKSVKVSDFSMADPTLRTGQTTRLSAIIETTADIEISNLTVYNLGKISTVREDPSKWKEVCSKTELEPIGNQPAVMECVWELKAPSEAELGDIETKTYSPRLLLRYKRNYSHQKPIKLHFKDPDEITEVKQYERKFSNNEIKLLTKVENPVRTDRTVNLDLTVQATEGVVSDDFRISPRPVEIFDSCEGVRPSGMSTDIDAEEGVSAADKQRSAPGFSFTVDKKFNGKARFSCKLSEDSSVTRNLVFSTSYKYQQSPKTNVEVSK